MLFGIYDICKLLCSNSRGSLVGHVLKDRITENIRLVSYIELGIFHEDYSRFVWLIDIFICLCRVERKFIWSPTDHISYTTSARVWMELGFETNHISHEVLSWYLLNVHSKSFWRRRSTIRFLSETRRDTSRSLMVLTYGWDGSKLWTRELCKRVEV